MYNYKDTYRLMRKFYNLGANEVRIMDYLMERDIAEVTYSKLTEEIGLDKKTMVSNVRKAILHLQELKLVCVVNKWLWLGGFLQIKRLKIQNWMENLIANTFYPVLNF